MNIKQEFKKIKSLRIMFKSFKKFPKYVLETWSMKSYKDAIENNLHKVI
jgi:hypothetical protein